MALTVLHEDFDVIVSAGVRNADTESAGQHRTLIIYESMRDLNYLCVYEMCYRCNTAYMCRYMYPPTYRRTSAPYHQARQYCDCTASSPSVYFRTSRHCSYCPSLTRLPLALPLSSCPVASNTAPHRNTVFKWYMYRAIDS